MKRSFTVSLVLFAAVLLSGCGDGVSVSGPTPTEVSPAAPTVTQVIPPTTQPPSESEESSCRALTATAVAGSFIKENHSFGPTARVRITRPAGSNVEGVHLAAFDSSQSPQPLVSEPDSGSFGAGNTIILTVDIPCNTPIQLDAGCGLNPPPNAGNHGYGVGNVFIEVFRGIRECPAEKPSKPTPNPSPSPSPSPNPDDDDNDDDGHHDDDGDDHNDNDGNGDDNDGDDNDDDGDGN